MPGSVVLERIVAEIGRRGPIPFVEAVELALYDPEGGFYTAGGGRSGRPPGGHFLTSPEVGPLFGAVLARALDAWWRELGEPDPFMVVDAGAGPGTLARSALAAAPVCAPALRYVLVERSPAQRRLHAERLVLEDAAFAFAPHDADPEAPPTLTGRGPICVSLPELPRVAGPAVVVANELLESLSFALLERAGAGWLEVRVGTDVGGALREVLVPAPADAAAMADRLAPAAAPGARIPIQEVAQRWLRDALSLVAGGRVVAFDYGCDTAALASRPWTEWVRTYRWHERGGHPMHAVGELGIACEIAVDQLALVRPPDRSATQAAWLELHGIGELVDEARVVWAKRAHVGDLDALRARSRVVEAEALLDPAGLGGCRVLEWAG